MKRPLHTGLQSLSAAVFLFCGETPGTACSYEKKPLRAKTRKKTVRVGRSAFQIDVSGVSPPNGSGGKKPLGTRSFFFLSGRLSRLRAKFAGERAKSQNKRLLHTSSVKTTAWSFFGDLDTKPPGMDLNKGMGLISPFFSILPECRQETRFFLSFPERPECACCWN